MTVAVDQPRLLARFLSGILESRRDVALGTSLAIATIFIFIAGPLGLGEGLSINVPLSDGLPGGDGVRSSIGYLQSFNYWISFLLFPLMYFLAVEAWSQFSLFFNAARGRGALRDQAGAEIAPSVYDVAAARALKLTAPLWGWLLLWGVAGNVAQWWFFSAQFLLGYEPLSTLIGNEVYSDFAIDWQQIARSATTQDLAWRIAQAVFSLLHWAYFGFIWAFAFVVPALFISMTLSLRDMFYLRFEKPGAMRQIVFAPRKRRLNIIFEPLRRAMRAVMAFSILAALCFFVMSAYYSIQWDCQRALEASSVQLARCVSTQAYVQGVIVDFIRVSGLDAFLSAFNVPMFKATPGAAAPVAATLESFLTTSPNRFAALFPWFTLVSVVLFLVFYFVSVDLIRHLRDTALLAIEDLPPGGDLDFQLRDDLRDELRDLDVQPLGAKVSPLLIFSLGMAAVVMSFFFKLGIIFFGLAALLVLVRSFNFFSGSR